MKKHLKTSKWKYLLRILYLFACIALMPPEVLLIQTYPQVVILSTTLMIALFYYWIKSQRSWPLVFGFTFLLSGLRTEPVWTLLIFILTVVLGLIYSYAEKMVFRMFQNEEKNATQ